MSEIYNLMAKCKNCKNQQWIIDIPAGTHVSEHCAENDIRCTYCKCVLHEGNEESKTKEKKSKK